MTGYIHKVELPKVRCNDCGVLGVEIEIWQAQLVPHSRTGFFCFDCFEKRTMYAVANNKPMPMNDYPPHPASPEEVE